MAVGSETLYSGQLLSKVLYFLSWTVGMGQEDPYTVSEMGGLKLWVSPWVV